MKALPPFFDDPTAAPCFTLTDLFFSTDADEKAVAKEVCHECPQRQECWSYAVATNAEAGVWAGYEFPDEGRKARRQQRFVAELGQRLEAS